MLSCTTARCVPHPHTQLQHHFSVGTRPSPDPTPAFDINTGTVIPASDTFKNSADETAGNFMPAEPHIVEDPSASGVDLNAD